MNVGQVVEFSYRQYDFNAPRQERIVTLRGTVMPSPKWLNSGEFALTTGNPDFPWCVVQKDKVIGYEQVEQEKTRSFTVKSGEKAYKVLMLSTSTFFCNCTGFGFRKHCKHVAAVQNKLQNNNKGG